MQQKKLGGSKHVLSRLLISQHPVNSPVAVIHASSLKSYQYDPILKNVISNHKKYLESC